MPWIGDVEDARSIGGHITSASITRRSMLDFENLDCKIARGLRKFKSPQQKAKLNQRRHHLQADCLDDLRLLQN